MLRCVRSPDELDSRTRLFKKRTSRYTPITRNSGHRIRKRHRAPDWIGCRSTRWTKLIAANSNFSRDARLTPTSLSLKRWSFTPARYTRGMNIFFFFFSFAGDKRRRGRRGARVLWKSDFRPALMTLSETKLANLNSLNGQRLLPLGVSPPRPWYLTYLYRVFKRLVNRFSSLSNRHGRWNSDNW